MGISYHSWQEQWPEPTKDENEPVTVGMLDYYQRPFLLLNNEITRICQDFKMPHSIRKRFWQLVPPGEYPIEEGRVFLNSYLKAVEAELAKLIRKFSLAYFLHLYRRLAPGPVGIDQQPATIGLTRAVLEAAIQKYACFQLCSKIAASSTISIDKVLGGLLVAPEFEHERNVVSQGNQLVLTDFTSSDLLAFYDLERLAYEIWRATAALRTIGKGAPLIVYEPPDCFADGRSPELDFLVTSYDHRINKFVLSRSASGVVFSNTTELSVAGCVFLPTYNLNGVTSKVFDEFFSRMYGLRLLSEVTYNFVWIPFNLREYRKAHLPFAIAFYKRHGVSLDAVLAVVAALLLRTFLSWHYTRGISTLRYWQRAYEGPYPREFIRDEVLSFIPSACKTLDIQKTALDAHDIQAAIHFWELDESNRKDIDLSYSGPHYLFLPVQSDRAFIDYAWIFRRLHDLFVGIWIPDQNFKGDALEKYIRKDKSLLPTTPCRSNTGEERQIDYAVLCGNHLVIAECKAVSKSIGFERGDPKAIKHRTDKVIELGLSEVDDKAKWLVKHPVGNNYNVTEYNYILPVVISPFVEFIPSKDTRYWLSEDIPRVLTPTEFEDLLKDVATVENAFNRIALRQNMKSI